MSINRPRLPLLATLPVRVARSVDPALTWLKRELECARRDNQDAQFMATPHGGLYQHPDWLNR